VLLEQGLLLLRLHEDSELLDGARFGLIDSYLLRCERNPVTIPDFVPVPTRSEIFITFRDWHAKSTRKSGDNTLASSIEIPFFLILDRTVCGDASSLR
jgi:hypothetical protein